jgi:CubicO group peptidase (beta-lactamase class C family)
MTAHHRALIAVWAVGLPMLSPCEAAGEEREAGEVPNWVVYPEDEWVRITPEQAGLDVKQFKEVLAQSKVRGSGWGGIEVGPDAWGAVLCRGGYLVHTWGDPKYKCQSASLGKNVTWVLVGLAVDAGLIDWEDPIRETWTGEGDLSHPHKYLTEGHHRALTWRHVLEHRSGFVLESGYHWRTKTVFHKTIPPGVKWTGDPLFDNYAHNPPGGVRRYSSGAFWRLSQALTALWDRDLKEVIDERVFRHLGIPADRWDWLPGKAVYGTGNFYPDIPNYGEYVGPPYEVQGHVVRGGPGWIVMSPEDLARFGLLIATRGTWKGKRLVSPEFLPNLQYGVGIHAFAGDPETMVHYAKINTKGFPFGGVGDFSFPKELIAGPVVGPE